MQEEKAGKSVEEETKNCSVRGQVTADGPSWRAGRGVDVSQAVALMVEPSSLCCHQGVPNFGLHPWGMAFGNGCFHATAAACQGSRRLPLGAERFTSVLPALQAWLVLLARV